MYSNDGKKVSKYGDCLIIEVCDAKFTLYGNLCVHEKIINNMKDKWKVYGYCKKYGFMENIVKESIDFSEIMSMLNQ